MREEGEEGEEGVEGGERFVVILIPSDDLLPRTDELLAIAIQNPKKKHQIN
ncbi:MAG: hypothetical protein WBA41_12625 [Rivularia sp. (in: cyanobacteria)]